MHLNFQELQSLAMSGASLRLSAKTFTPDQLRAIALTAAGTGSTLTLCDLGAISADNLRSIAMAGRGQKGGGVVFDFT